MASTLASPISFRGMLHSGGVRSHQFLTVEALGISVICAVDFNGFEWRGVVRQEIAHLHALWVEGALPAVRGE
jgi:hypothetical protein